MNAEWLFHVEVAAMTSALPKMYRAAVSDANVRRRHLLRGALAVFASALTRSTSTRAQAQQKMSKQEAEYQDSPKDIRMCATCTLFEPPASCKVVEGNVSPKGWCKAFALADYQRDGGGAGRRHAQLG